MLRTSLSFHDDCDGVVDPSEQRLRTNGRDLTGDQNGHFLFAI